MAPTDNDHTPQMWVGCQVDDNDTCYSSWTTVNSLNIFIPPAFMPTGI